jgi:Major tropism determinant N-terminal domain
MANRIQLRRDTAANWTRENTILSQGEPGFDLTANKLKVGDGVTAWADLAYASGSGNTLVNGSYTVSLEANGSLTLPTGAQIIIDEPGTLATSSNNGTSIFDYNANPGSENVGDLGYAGLLIDTNGNHNVKIRLVKKSDDPYNPTTIDWTFGIDGSLTLPEGGVIKNSTGTNILDGLGGGAANIGNYTFDNDNLNMPLESKLNSGGVGVANSAEFGTSVTVSTSTVVNSEIYMGSGYGEFRSIYNKVGAIESGLTYAGVEGFNYAQYGDVNFSGMVSQTPHIDSMYTIGISTSTGRLIIGFTQNGQKLKSDDWSVTVGTLTTDYTVNGLFADTTQTVISSGGNNGIALTTDRGTVLFGNRPEQCVPTASSHFHIMKKDPTLVDLFFGDDLNYVKLPTTDGVEIGSGGNSWVFSNTGTVTFPDSTVQTTAYIDNTPPALAGLLSTATTIAITAATAQGGPSANVDVTITNHQVDHYGSTDYTGNILSTGLVVIPDTTQSPPIAHTILQVGSQSLTQSYSLGASGSPAYSHYIAYAYVVTAFGTVWSAPTSGQFGSVCLIAGTMILLSDGTRKAIEDITYTDKMLSWNFDQGCYAETKAVWIKRSETGSQYNLLTFSDGTTLRTFDQHRIFNKQAGAFTYPMTDATPIGTITVNEHGQEITLVDKQVIVDTIEYYNVITDYHMNLFSDSILTSCRFNNIYPITDMKFVKDTRTLRTRDEFVNIPDRFFYGLRLAEQTTDIETVEWYVTRLLALEESFEAVAV